MGSKDIKKEIVNFAISNQEFAEGLKNRNGGYCAFNEGEIKIADKSVGITPTHYLILGEMECGIQAGGDDDYSESFEYEAVIKESDKNKFDIVDYDDFMDILDDEGIDAGDLKSMKI